MKMEVMKKDARLLLPGTHPWNARLVQLLHTDVSFHEGNNIMLLLRKTNSNAKTVRAVSSLAGCVMVTLTVVTTVTSILNIVRARELS